MRKVVSEAWLRDEISAHMGAQVLGSGTFWARPVRRKRVGDGPNWRHSFNEGAVPAGYTAGWERIRHKFEDAYDLADE
jgi:hypothetical protein